MCLLLQFLVHAREYYALLCDVILHDLKPELRSILRKFLLRVGHVAHVITNNQQQQQQQNQQQINNL